MLSSICFHYAVCILHKSLCPHILVALRKFRCLEELRYLWNSCIKNKTAYKIKYRIVYVIVSFGMIDNVYLTWDSCTYCAQNTCICGPKYPVIRNAFMRIGLCIYFWNIHLGEWRFHLNICRCCWWFHFEYSKLTCKTYLAVVLIYVDSCPNWMLTNYCIITLRRRRRRVGQETFDCRGSHW